MKISLCRLQPRRKRKLLGILKGSSQTLWGLRLAPAHIYIYLSTTSDSQVSNKMVSLNSNLEVGGPDRRKQACITLSWTRIVCLLAYALFLIPRISWTTSQRSAPVAVGGFSLNGQSGRQQQELNILLLLLLCSVGSDVFRWIYCHEWEQAATLT